MNEISFHAAANLTAEPELRYTPNARPVASVRLAVNSRRRTAEGEWVDAATTFLDGTMWGEQAERAAARLQKGDRVVVTGTLVTRTWTGQDGTERRKLEVAVEELGASLLFRDLKIER
ncbi:MAG TPA: single-stranded DNA-binding protein [Pseudonocardiaceae bacterium]|nr:single-stranded DNA-binding protein [Pseudonocardiaceae bacterium]